MLEFIKMDKEGKYWELKYDTYKKTELCFSRRNITIKSKLSIENIGGVSSFQNLTEVRTLAKQEMSWKL